MASPACAQPAFSNIGREEATAGLSKWCSFRRFRQSKAAAPSIAAHIMEYPRRPGRAWRALPQRPPGLSASDYRAPAGDADRHPKGSSCQPAAVTRLGTSAVRRPSPRRSHRGSAPSPARSAHCWSPRSPPPGPSCPTPTTVIDALAWQAMQEALEIDTPAGDPLGQAVAVQDRLNFAGRLGRDEIDLGFLQAVVVLCPVQIRPWNFAASAGGFTQFGYSVSGCGDSGSGTGAVTAIGLEPLQDLSSSRVDSPARARANGIATGLW
jgi:hypothetical protein